MERMAETEMKAIEIVKDIYQYHLGWSGRISKYLFTITDDSRKGTGAGLHTSVQFLLCLGAAGSI